MNDQLTNNQTIELRNRMRNGTFDSEYEIKTLIRSGYDPQKAEFLVNKVVIDFKDEFIDEINQEKKRKNREHGAWFIVIMSSILIFYTGRDASTELVLISIVIACLAGYFGFPKKPFPAIIGFAVGCLLMPFVLSFFLKNKQSLYVAEFIFPAAVCFGPAALVKYLLDKLLYSRK